MKTLLKWKEPQNEYEISQVFILLEDRDTRVLVTDVATQHMSIPPTHCYSKDELVEYNPQTR